MLIEKLQKGENFTNQEKAVAEYILQHPKEIQNMSADDLAKAAFSSKASVIRLSKKLGAEGYRELKYRLIMENVQNDRINELLAREPITENSGYREIVDILPELYDQAIEQTKNGFDQRIMQRVFNLLLAAKRLDIYGTGISYTLAEAAAYKFSTIGLECRAWESINIHYIAANKEKRSVSFIISFTGGNLSMIQTAKYLKRSGSTYVVGIVGRHNEEMKKWCDEVIVVPSRDSLLSMKIVSSFTAVSYVLDIFFAMYMASNYSKCVKTASEAIRHEALRIADDNWDI